MHWLVRVWVGACLFMVGFTGGIIYVDDYVKRKPQVVTKIVVERVPRECPRSEAATAGRTPSVAPSRSDAIEAPD